jgi:general secretion pathway protein D
MPTRPIINLLMALASMAVVTAPVSAQLPASADATRRHEIRIASKAIPEVRDALATYLADRVQFQQQGGMRMFLQTDGQMAFVEFQADAQVLTVEGTRALADEVAAITTAMSGMSLLDRDHTLRVLQLDSDGQGALRDANVLRLHGEPASPTERMYAERQLTLPRFLGIRRGRLASTQQTPPDGSATQQQTPNSPPRPAQESDAPSNDLEDQPTQGLPLPQFEGVEVEMLPEIDAIILRGRDQQLQDLAEIIKQIDQASRQAQPKIEVIPLQHVNSATMAEMIEEAEEDLLSTRQGRVTINPLNKPNSLLLIGWGEAIEAIKELIAELDQPVDPESQFEVFQLEHANATDVEQQLQEFFDDREGLGPVIQSTVDNRSNAIVVHASPRDMHEVRRLIDSLDVPTAANRRQTRIFNIQNSLAADVAETLQDALDRDAGAAGAAVELLDADGQAVASSGILGESQITVNERNNTIVVTTAAGNIKLIERLIAQLDTPGAVAKIKIFPILNGDAGAMVETLRALIPSQTPGSEPTPQLSSAPEESSLVPLRFTVDARGNNVIAVGSDGDLKIVEALIIRLDESDTMQRKSTVYQLKNSPAVDVALAINEFLQSKRQVETAAPGSSNPFEQLEKEVVVVPEPVQNKLILSATPRYYEEISKLIEQLDQQPPQVMIQVLIAEVFLGNTDEFGMELGLQNSVLFDRSLLGDLVDITNTRATSTQQGVVTETVQEIIAASNVPGFNFNSTDSLGNSGSEQALRSSGQVGGQGISNFSLGRSSDQADFGGMVLSASSENVSFLLRALEESRRLDVLSRPQVLTLDNQQAFIQVGQRVPRIVASTINQIGSQNQIELENVGLIIGVTPRISPEGNVVMEIDAEKSELGPEAEGIPVSISNDGTVVRSPRIDTITAQATVSAADSETIILGGLISERSRQIHRKVPWLGDLPVLKHLFRFDSYLSERTELLIIMTPHIIRSERDMEQMKQAEFARMSWCEADVFDVHGNVYLPPNMATEMLDQGELPTIYPDIDPRGSGVPPTIHEAPPLHDPAPRSLDEPDESLPPPREPLNLRRSSGASAPTGTSAVRPAAATETNYGRGDIRTSVTASNTTAADEAAINEASPSNNPSTASRFKDLPSLPPETMNR